MGKKIQNGLVVDTADAQKFYATSSPLVTADATKAFTQTYSTTASTVPAVTFAAYTVTSTVDAPAGGTGANGGGWDTSGHRDSAIAVINANRADIVAMKAKQDLNAADALVNRKLINLVIDALQLNGLAG